MHLLDLLFYVAFNHTLNLHENIITDIGLKSIELNNLQVLCIHIALIFSQRDQKNSIAFQASVRNVVTI